MKIAAHALCLFLVVGSTLFAQESIKPGKEHSFLAEVEGEWSVTMASPGGDLTGVKTKGSGVIVLKRSKIFKMDADCHAFERVLAEGLERYPCRDC